MLQEREVLLGITGEFDSLGSASTLVLVLFLLWKYGACTTGFAWLGKEGFEGFGWKLIANLLQNPTTPVNEHHSLILAIRELLSRDWIVRVNHIHRETNVAANFLTSFSLSFPLGLQLLCSSYFTEHS